jgi:hypothetical protein
MSSHRSVSPPRRPGVILLVVVVLLALFMVVGLSFLLYAESAASASRIYREAQSLPLQSQVVDMDPNALLNWALGQLIYDVSDRGEDVYSAIRGHGLARTMYGWNYGIAGLNFDPTKNNNVIAFNGVGPPKASGKYNPNVNYTFFPSDGFLRDPERIPPRSGSDPFATPFLPVTAPYSGGFNVPYTFPDRANMVLGALKAQRGNPATPAVLMPSFHHTDGTPFEGWTPNSPGWTDVTQNPWLRTDAQAAGFKYMVLRPRPADMYWGGPSDPHSFPLPVDAGGDVQNLPGTTGWNGGSNDSFWIDLGFPVQTTSGGRQFKPLFAFLVLDLDNRLNVNVHGNNRGGVDSNGKVVHLSNQGLGRHEINLGKVLDANLTSGYELQKLFVGTTDPGTGGHVKGRYNSGFPNDNVPGQPAVPYPGEQAFPASRPSYLAKLDSDAGQGFNGTSAAATGRFQMPGSTPTSRYAAFPTFGNGYDNFANGSPDLASSPLLYFDRYQMPGTEDTPLNDGGPNVNLRDENLYHLLGSSAGGDYQNAYLYKLLPNNLNLPTVRNLLTTRSYDLDVPGASPWVSDPTQAATAYTLQTNPPAGTYPKGAGFSFTPPTPPYTSTPPSTSGWATWKPGSDYLVYNGQADGRAALLPRIDLNRKLVSYYDATTHQVTPTTFAQAQQDRQQFARDILDRLVLATGAVPVAQLASASPEQKNAVHWLAQLAVNIVDYIDEDDIITCFSWNPTNPADVVFGTEVPKLVINEAYAEMRNAPGDTNATTGAQQPFHVNFWLELYNPHPQTGQNDVNIRNQDRASALLQHAGATGPEGVYRIQFVDELAAPPTGLRNTDNTDGSVKPPAPPTAVKAQVTSFTGTAGGSADTEVVLPSDGNQSVPQGSNQGFYVLAPQDGFESNQALTPTLKVTNGAPQNGIPTGMSYTVPPPPDGSVPQQPTITVLLQRLACPYMPHNDTIGPTYNPYVTVDYITGLKVADIVEYGAKPAGQLVAMQRPEHNQTPRKATGRPQPYAALQTLRIDQSGNGGKPDNTFFQHNTSATQPFDWLVHLDRPLTNPTEVLQVSGFKPHELTQQFITGTAANQKFQHLAPWKDLNARIYRALEYLSVGDRTYLAGMSAPTSPLSTSGRRPGMVNVNTVWDKPVFDALFDAKAPGTPATQNPNFFDQSQVDAAWTALLKHRRQATGTDPGLDGTGTVDTPYLGYAAPSTAFNQTVFNTQPTPPNTQDFQGATTPQHPYVLEELLTKASGNITTRSNCFVVYLTVGFFEVMDNTVRPVKLGAEVRGRDGLPIRHKFFAVIDRTNLALDFPDPTASPPETGSNPVWLLRQAGSPTGQPSLTPVFMTSETTVPPSSSPSTVTLTITGGVPSNYDGNTVMTSDSQGNRYTGFSFASGRESVLFADFGTQQEMVLVKAVNPTSIQVTFPSGTKGHGAGFTLTNVRLGNPGPQSNFDYQNPRYSAVVPVARVVQ